MVECWVLFAGPFFFYCNDGHIFVRVTPCFCGIFIFICFQKSKIAVLSNERALGAAATAASAHFHHWGCQGAVVTPPSSCVAAIRYYQAAQKGEHVAGGFVLPPTPPQTLAAAVPTSPAKILFAVRALLSNGLSWWVATVVFFF